MKMDVLKRHPDGLSSLFHLRKYYTVLVIVRVVLDDGTCTVYTDEMSKVPRCIKAFLQIIEQNLRCFKK